MKVYKIIIFFLLISFYSEAQDYMGKWKSHLSNRNCIGISHIDHRIYALSDKGLFYYDTLDNSVNKVDKKDGLSGYNTTSVFHDTHSESLFIGYRDGTIDIIGKNNSITNIYDIKRKSYVAKAINKFVDIDETVYICADFGIVLFNSITNEFIDHYIIGNNGNESAVYDLIEHDGNLYAATSKGIKVANKNAADLKNYSEWKTIDYIPDFDKKFNTLIWYNGFLYASSNTKVKEDEYTYKLYKIDVENKTSSLFLEELKNDVKALQVYNNQLFVATRKAISIYNVNLSLLKLISRTDFKTFSIPLSCTGILLDDNGGLWYSDDRYGLIRNNYNNTEPEVVRPNAPYYNNSFSLHYSPNRLWSASGGIQETAKNDWRTATFSLLENGIWRSFDKNQIKAIGNAVDVLELEHSNRNPNIMYIATGSAGIFEMDFSDVRNAKVKQYTDTTPGVTLKPKYDHITMVADIAIDENDNLWTSSPYSENSFSVKTAGGKWYALPYGGKANYGQIIVTKSGFKWAQIKQYSGVFIFHDRGTLEDAKDDFHQRINITGKDGNVLANNVYSMVEDQSNYVWLGTSNGVVVYYNPNSVEKLNSGRFYGSKILVDLNGRLEYLMEGKKVTALAVDGANRKWIGTEKAGVFLVSEDGTQQIAHFTEENSPLSSSTVIDIAINEDDGTVYFSTANGLDSYKGTATSGNQFLNDVYAYPNPVKHDYDGPIIIKGLLDETVVKITDVAGHLVTEFLAKGGQAIWDGKNLNGNRVKTGVYLVFVSDDAGQKSAVTKILFIN